MKKGERNSPVNKVSDTFVTLFLNRIDDRTSNNIVPFIKNDGLARSDRPLRSIELDFGDAFTISITFILCYKRGFVGILVPDFHIQSFPAAQIIVLDEVQFRCHERGVQQFISRPTVITFSFWSMLVT